MSSALRFLLCLLVVAMLLGCGRRAPEQAPATTTAAVWAADTTATPADSIQSASLPQYPAPGEPYPLLTPPPAPGDDALLAPYPAPTIPPVAGQDTPPLALHPVNLQLSPDSRYAVYNGDAERDRVYTLFSLALDGGAPVQLSAFTPQREELFSFAITPDSSIVVYQTRWGELYRAPIAGGPSEVLLAEPIEEFLLSPDGQWAVAWVANDGLYSAPLAGGPAVRLSDEPTGSGSYAISPDSRSVVFVQGDMEVSALYRVPIEGGQRVLLSPSHSQQLRVMGLALTPDSQQVVFGVREEPVTPGLSIYSAPLGGGPPVALWDARQGGPASDHFELSPDGRLVLFSAGPLGGSAQRYSAPVGGGPATPLGDPLASGWPSSGIEVVGEQALYADRRQGDHSDELYSAPLAGGAAVRLSGPRPFAGGRLFFQGAALAGRVVFAADLDSPGVVGLYSAPAAGGETSLLSAGLPPGASVEYFTLSSDETLAVFGIMAGSRASLAAVYAARLDGSASWQVLGGGGIVEFRLLPDGRFLYQTDQDRDGYTELHIAPLGSP